MREGDTAGARRAFELALSELDSSQALEGLAKALYLEGDYSAAAAHFERAYSAYRREGNALAAGSAARSIAWITGNVFGDWAVQSGWFARACTILEESGEDGPERGWVLIIKAFPEPSAQRRESLLRDATRSDAGAGIPMSSSRRFRTSAVCL